MFVLTVDQRHSRRRARPGRGAARLAGRPAGRAARLRAHRRRRGAGRHGRRRRGRRRRARTGAPRRLERRHRRRAGARAVAREHPGRLGTGLRAGPQGRRTRQVEPPTARGRRTEPERAAAAQAALDLLASVVQRRTDPGWEAVDLISRGTTQTEVAERLGITKQAVSQRLRAATWAPEVAGRDLAAQLLKAADPRTQEGSRP